MAEQQLSRDSWLLAGQDLLRAGGISAVKLGALTSALGRTTGSFYHHFASMPEYLEALADYYGTDQVMETLKSFEPLPPRQRILTLIRTAHQAHMHPLSVAMRDWAATNATAAKAVSESDERLLRFVEQALVELGFPTDEAQTRAFLLVAAGVARIEAPWEPARNLDRLVLTIITGEPQ